MSRALEIYPLKKRIERELELIKKDPYNAELILKYHQTRVAEGISPARIHKCLNTIKLISRMLEKSFADATKDDFVKLVAEFESTDWSDWTKRDYKVILKHFYKWFRNWEDGMPPEVRWIKKTSSAQNKRPILPKDLLTPEEKDALLRATYNPRDRALFEILFESGRRLEEILTLHLRDIEFDTIGAKLYVDGKIGADFVRIIASAPSLAIWLDHHPARNHPDCPVWIGFGSTNLMNQIAYAAAVSILKKAAKRAGIKKRVFYYLFRHTRVDETQGILTEPQQCMMFGWRFGSAMPATYMKRYGKHIDNAQSIMNGIKPQEKTVVVNSQPRKCSRCSLENSHTSKFCNRCGALLDASTSSDVDQKKTMLDKLLYGIAAEPQKFEELRVALTKICKESQS